MYMEQITERIGLAAGIAPQTLNNARLNSDAIDMSKFKRAIFILSIGANAGSISAWMQESADNVTWTANDSAGAFSGGAGGNTSMTGLITANKLYTFEARMDNMTSGKRYMRLQIKEVNSQNVLVCVVAYGDEADPKPGNKQNAAAATTQNVVT